MGIALIVGLVMPIGDVAAVTAPAYAEDTAPGSDSNPDTNPGDGSPTPQQDSPPAEQPQEPNPGTTGGEDSPAPAAPAEQSPADPAPSPTEESQLTPAPSSELGASSDMAPMSGVPLPDNSAPVSSGPPPKITSSMSPVGALASGGTRVFTISYENEANTVLTYARLWHQYMTRADHVTSFTVSCASEVGGVAGGSCPSWVPVGTQSIPDGLDHEYYRTFAGVFTFAAHQKLTFTVTVTSSFQVGICTETGSVMNGGWAEPANASPDA